MEQNYDNILNELEDLVLSSTRVLFSNNRLVNEDEFLRVFDDLRASMPQEISEAKRIVAEKQRYIEEAEKEAKAIIEQAKRHVETLLDENNIMQLAEEQAKDYIQQALQQKRDLERDAYVYAADVFKYLESQLEKTLDSVRNGYADLRQARGNSMADEQTPEE